MPDGQEAGEQDTVRDDAEAEGGENDADAVSEAAADVVEDAAEEDLLQERQHQHSLAAYLATYLRLRRPPRL